MGTVPVMMGHLFEPEMMARLMARGCLVCHPMFRTTLGKLCEREAIQVHFHLWQQGIAGGTCRLDFGTRTCAGSKGTGGLVQQCDLSPSLQCSATG
jgi:hypothetical protein